MYTCQYFKDVEFERCTPICQRHEMDDSFLIKLDLLRAKCGFPLVLNCAFRSRAFDISKGRSGDSMHCKGRAVDIRCSDPFKRASIVKHALDIGLRVGIASSFIHVDDKKSEKIIWTYENK